MTETSESIEKESIWLYTIRLIKGRDFVIPTETPVTGYVCVVSAGDIEVSSNSSSTIGTEYIWNQELSISAPKSNVMFSIYGICEQDRFLIGSTDLSFDSLSTSHPDDSWFSISENPQEGKYDIVGQVYFSIQVQLPPSIPAPMPPKREIPPLPKASKPALEVDNPFPKKLPTNAWDHPRPVKPPKPVPPAKPAKPLPTPPSKPAKPLPSPPMKSVKPTLPVKPLPVLPTKPVKPMKPVKPLPPKPVQEESIVVEPVDVSLSHPPVPVPVPIPSPVPVESQEEIAEPSLPAPPPPELHEGNQEEVQEVQEVQEVKPLEVSEPSLPAPAEPAEPQEFPDFQDHEVIDQAQVQEVQEVQEGKPLEISEPSLPAPAEPAEPQSQEEPSQPPGEHEITQSTPQDAPSVEVITIEDLEPSTLCDCAPLEPSVAAPQPFDIPAPNCPAPEAPTA